MNRKLLRSILSLLMIVCYGKVLSQTYPDKISITLPSPNNIFATSYVNTTVNLYTGVPDVGLPLYTLESSELKLPIALAYKASGVRIQDVASTVGLNWSLSVGGAITRVVRGLPDESEKGYIGKNRTGVQINTGAESDQVRADRIASGEYDGEPDLFYIRTPTVNASFVFDENGVPVFNQPTRLTVSFQRTNGPDDNLNIVWTVIDEGGVRYTFGRFASDREVATNAPNVPECNSTWHLSTMTSFNNTDYMAFSYIAGNDLKLKTYNKIRMRFSSSSGCGAPAESVTSIDDERTYKAPKYISSITSNNGNINFNYLTTRKDLGGLQLFGIDIYNNNYKDLVKRYVLNSDYFDTVDPNPERNRLYLKNVYLVSGNDKESVRLYDFQYYVNPALRFPARSSVAFDHLGFYNNNSESTPFVPEANKQPDFDKTVQYSLKSIEHAQGGKTEFEYELNRWFDDVSQTEKLSGGLRIKTIKEYDNTGKVQTRSYEYKLENGRSSGQVMLKDIQYAKVTTLIIPLPPPLGGCSISGQSTYAGILFNITDINNAFTGYSRVKVTYSDGGNEVYLFTNFSDFSDKFTIINSLNGIPVDIGSIRQFGFPTSYAYKRGLPKFKGIYTATNHPVSEASYEYTPLLAEQKKARGITLSLSYTASGGANSNWYQTIYYQPTDCYKVTRETERIYDASDRNVYIAKTKDYEYSPDGALVRKTTYNTSEGTSYFDKIYYPENRAEIANLTDAEIQALAVMDRLIIPIREARYTGSNVEVKHTVFEAQTQTGAVVPTRVFPKKMLTSRNGGAFTEENVFTYDFHTGLLQTEVKRNGEMNSYIWGRDRKPLAKVTNAASNEIYYQGFEEISSSQTGNAFAGRRYYSGNCQVSFTRPNTKKYKLSYWRFVNSVWQLVLTDFTQDNMVIAEPYPIDEIRVYPVGARMTTYTGMPSIGITSACDANNVIRYYEYDDLRRLKAIKDLNGNILTQLSYQYACNCPLLIPKVQIEFRNQYVEQQEEYAYKRADIYAVVVDDAGNPVNTPGLVLKYRQTKDDSQTGITYEDKTIPVSGSETLIYSGLITEWYYNLSGAIVSQWYYDFTLLPGIGYKL